MSPHNYENDKAKNEKYAKVFNFTFGQIALASFLIAALSGIFLAIPYDVKNPLDSISLILLSNPAADLFRNIHYWSAQFFLVFTILHFWDHLRLSTEKEVKKGIWLRLTISLLAVFYVMLSGFILKGDADSIQAKNILTTLLNKIPLIGSELSYSLLGPAKDFQIPYVHHIATATIFLWIITIEHSKILWAKLRLVLYLIPIFIIAGFLFPPALHDNLTGIVKGPWYFLGLQETLHYLSYPFIAIIIAIIFLILVYLLPRFKPGVDAIVKKIIFASGIIYLLLMIIGLFFRGENWNFELPWKHKLTNEIKINSNFNFSTVSIDKLKEKKIPVVLGRREGCMFCHEKTKGFSPSHNPEAIGCASCHKGNIFSLDKSSAHKDMILIPGNLKDSKETCGTSNCHPDIPGRVDNSIMTTMTGIISVDHYTFGESNSLNEFNKITEIGHSPSDKHLRNLCASCHIGNIKDEPGPVTQLSRGGGCNACHLNYNEKSLKDIGSLSTNEFTNRDSFSEFSHPSLSIKIINDHCFGCHSRSGRISTNYEGWTETELDELPDSNENNFRQLDDGRIFSKTLPDVHFENKMECIDCHTSKEVMGDGNIYLHKEDQVKIQCTDCHLSGKAETTGVDSIDSESQKIITLRNYSTKDRKFLLTQKEKYVLTNTYLDSTNRAHLLTKNTGQDLVIKPPKFVCNEGKAHSRLSCNSCHTGWAPQCITCHTDYQPDEESYDLLDHKDVKGSWNETAADFKADEPTLGIKEVKAKDGTTKEVIDNFVPGMIINITDGSNKSFKRLFAPAFPHTIRKESRSCKSCHNNPLALGYGRGNLKFTKEGRWKFTSDYKLNSNDNLPEDAWIGFLKTRTKDYATRNNVRPFSVEEQKKILTAGACLTCHKPESGPMKEYLETGKIPRLSKKCIKPEWN